MKFYIFQKGYSVNNFYYNNSRHGIKAAARDWQYQINWKLQEFEKQFTELREKFDKTKHGFAVKLVFGYKGFFTKDGIVSNKIFDLTNVEKPLMDLLFNPDNHGKVPYKAPNLNIDDKHVMHVISRKVESDKDFIFVHIRIINIDSHRKHFTAA